MTFAEVMLVARKELRETLRDRRTLAIMILFPLVVYPLVSLATAQVMATRVNRTETEVSRVAVVGPAPLAGGVRARLERRHDALGDVAVSPSPATADDVMAGHLDALVEVAPALAGAAAVPTARVMFDETRDRSRTARERVADALRGSSEPACAPAYTVSAQGIAPRKAVGGYLLSKIMPLVIVVMVMLGAFHPAIDITAGERERGTLETTLSAPIARSALMAGKVLAVATLAALSGMLNLASMSLTVLGGARLALDAPPLSLPWLNVAAAFAVVPPAAFLFASVMVAIGALARSFKEAQTLLTPVYFLCMAPSLLAALGDFSLSGGAALIPGVGVTLLARDLIVGHASLAGTLAVLVSTTVYGTAALVLAARLYDSERLLGSEEAGVSLRDWLRHLVFGNRSDPRVPAPAAPIAAPTSTTAGHALALFAIAVLMLFAFAPLQKWRLGPGLAVFQWVGLFGLTVAYARGSGRPLREVLRLRRPSRSALAGAIMFGLSAWMVVGLLAEWVLPPPKHVEETLRHAISPSESGRGIVLTFLLVAVGPAVCEEALFRGPILRGLLARFSPAGAALLTGVLFGAFHGDIWRFVPTALLGAGLSAIAIASDSIVPAMVAHFVNNASLLLVVNRGLETSEAGTRSKLMLLALGVAGLIAAVALLARAKQTRRVTAP